MFDSDEAAYEEVRRGRAWGSLIFSPNFTEAMSHRVEFGANVDNISIDASEVEVKMDMSSKNGVEIPKLNDQFSITPISFRLQINKLVNYCSVISSSVS